MRANIRGPNLLVVVKREDEVRPVGSNECFVGARLALGLPAYSHERCKHTPGPWRMVSCSSGLKRDV